MKIETTATPTKLLQDPLAKGGIHQRFKYSEFPKAPPEAVIRGKRKIIFGNSMQWFVPQIIQIAPQAVYEAAPIPLPDTSKTWVFVSGRWEGAQAGVTTSLTVNQTRVINGRATPSAAAGGSVGLHAELNNGDSAVIKISNQSADPARFTLILGILPETLRK